MAHLSLYTNENKVDIVFIQEPYCYSGEPCYIPSVFYVSSHTNPRASLLIRREIVQNFMLLLNFSNPDNVQDDTKKREIWKTQQKLKKSKKKIYWQKLNHYNLPFKRQ